MANYQNYVALCSEKTLQSDAKGFFMQFVDRVTENAGREWVTTVFGRSRNDAERIRTIYTDPQVKEIVRQTLSCVQEIYRKKSGDVCVARRLEAEKLAKADPLKALMLYSQSAIRAPSDVAVERGKSLAYSLWGRSEVLMALNDYALALNDIRHALKLGLPDEYKGHVYWRMAICHKALGDANKSNVSYGLAKKLLEGNATRLKYLDEDMAKSYAQKPSTCRRLVPAIDGTRSKKLPNASKKLTVRTGEEMGRYFITKETIKTGETLVVEDPCVACLFPNCFGTHCHNCFERLVAPIGCSDCSNVAFCSAECRDVAVATYHKYECKYLDLLIGSGMSVLSHAALRLITQRKLENVLATYKNKESDRIFSLCTNAAKRTPQDFLQRTLMAAFLLRCLQKGGYFGDRDDVVPMDEEQYVIGELLLFYLQVLQFNAHEVYEANKDGGRLKNVKMTNVGVALYTTVAIFNHDCYPSLDRHFVGKKVVLTSVRPFGAGETVHENYGLSFTRRPLDERQHTLLGRYWFACKCLACKLDWPTYDKGLENVSKRVRCPSPGCICIFSLPVSSETLKCPKCNNDVSLSENIATLKSCESRYERAVELMEDDRMDEVKDLLCKAIDDFHRVSCPPHKATHLAQEQLRTLLLVDSANVCQPASRRQ